MLLGVVIGTATVAVLAVLWILRRRRRDPGLAGLTRYGRALGAMADAEVRAKTQRVEARREATAGMPSVVVEGDARPRPRPPAERPEPARPVAPARRASRSRA